MSEQADRLSRALSGRYGIERELGSGGTATVYLAHDAKHNRKVALKVLRQELSSAIAAERFLREIEIEGQLHHPHILPLYDSDQVDGFLFYVMPYIEGETLRHRIDREGPLEFEEALKLTDEIADALDHAHSMGFVHRDLKPENILLDAGHAVLADFGLARAIDVAVTDRLTATGLAVGTPRYMSPEQASDADRIDGRTDVYSLACVVYEMLSGEPPFYGSTPQALVRRHIHEPPPSISVIRPGLPPAVDRALKKALQKIPADRYASASKFAAALRSEDREHLWRAPTRKRLAVLVGGLAAAGVALTLVAFPPVSVELDPRKIVVFPVSDARGAAVQGAVTNDVARALWAELNATEFFRAVDGWSHLDSSRLTGERPVTEGHAISLAKRQRARYAVIPRFTGENASRLMLDVHDLVGDSMLQRSVLVDAEADAWPIGLAAARELLPVHVPGSAVGDVGSLRGRSVRAITEFLRAEEAYRNARFEEALRHYSSAVEHDSTFALAALRGAQAASWNLRRDVSARLVAVALRDSLALSPHYRAFARGLEDYIKGEADSAIKHYEQALGFDRYWAEAWMGLGEVFTHLLPRRVDVAERAAEAFEQVSRLDPEFAPVRYHRLEIALRRGDVAAVNNLLPRFEASNPDSHELRQTRLMVRCVTRSPTRVDWRRAVLESPNVVIDAARSMAAGAGQPACAEAAWRAVLEYDTAAATSNAGFARAWAGIWGLQSLLLTQGRYRELRTLLDSAAQQLIDTRIFIFLDAFVDPEFQAEAESLAANLWPTHRDESWSATLWAFGVWEARRGSADRARAIVAELERRAGEKGSSEDSLLAALVDVHAQLAARAGDPPIERLRLLLSPRGGPGDIQWELWASRANERLALAQLYLERQEFREALQVAANFDSPQPVIYPLYLSASLVIRLQAADALGDGRLAQWYRSRLRSLGRQDLL